MYLTLHDIDIVCLTEHWLMPTEIDAIKINGYKRVSVFCRKENKNGGVVIFSKNNDKFKIKELSYVVESSIEKVIELVGIEVKLYENSFNILSVYRSPQSSTYDFFLTLDSLE